MPYVYKNKNKYEQKQKFKIGLLAEGFESYKTIIHFG